MRKLVTKAIVGALRHLPARVIEDVILGLERRIGIGSGTGSSRSGERVVFDVLLKLFEGEVHIFDVGANQGQYAAEALERMGDSRAFALHCFEPSKFTFEKLVERHGGNPRVTLNRFGMAQEAGTAHLFSNDAGSGLASLTRRRLDHIGVNHGRLEESVELRRLDDYCAEKGIERIHLLKIDVEGHELDVLAGAKAFLEQGRIDLVQFEFGGCNIDTRTYLQDFYYLFAGHGFELFRILPNRKLFRLPKYRETDEKFRTGNFLAARKMLEVGKQRGRAV